MYVDIISREGAKRLGLRFYRLVKPCNHGHFSVRYVSDGQCLDCVANKRVRKSTKDKKPNGLTRSELIK